MGPGDLARYLPDQPHWIDLRGLLLTGRCDLYAEADPALGFVARSWDFPFAAMSVILTFWAHGMHFSLLPLIGMIALSGVVVNASIVMVDSVHQAQHKLGRSASEAERFDVVIEAFVTRLRPVLVTSLSTFGGVLPTAYGFGGYDAVMSPMSLALGWGLALTSGVTLFLVPALYVSANDINRQIDVWRRGRRPELGVADATEIGGDGPEEAAA